MYGNEKGVGKGIKIANRNDIFITTKLKNEDHGRVTEAVQEHLKRLDTDYIDVFLVSVTQKLKGPPAVVSQISRIVDTSLITWHDITVCPRFFNSPVSTIVTFDACEKLGGCYADPLACVRQAQCTGRSEPTNQGEQWSSCLDVFHVTIQASIKN